MAGTRAWHLKSRPSGMPDMSNFELKELDLLSSSTAWSGSRIAGFRSIPTCAAA